MAGIRQRAAGHDGSWPGRLLPDWCAELVALTHPDDETFGLGAVAKRGHKVPRLAGHWH
jgi:hypothetical protein